jgi:high-affinity iron transporter
MVNKQQDVLTALQSLQQVSKRYIQDQYEKGTDSKDEDAILSEFVILLQQTKEYVQTQNQTRSLEAITQIREKWLSVEGSFVAQSASICSDSERDMVVVIP